MRATVTALTFALATSLAACGDDGRELRAPTADQTTTTAAPATPATAPPTASTASTASTATDEVAAADGAAGTTAALGQVSGDASRGPAGAAGLHLSSSAFGEGEPVPAQHTCAGADVAPPLSWSGVPAGTTELAVVVRDRDADGFVHWVVAGLPATSTGVAADVPAPAVEGLNDFGLAGWSGPCPPSGTHHYDFRLYALAQPSGIAPGAPGEQAAQQIESAAAVASAALAGTANTP